MDDKLFPIRNPFKLLLFVLYKYYQSGKYDKGIEYFSASIVFTLIVWFNAFAIAGFFDVVSTFAPLKGVSKIQRYAYFSVVYGSVMLIITTFLGEQKIQSIALTSKQMRAANYAVVLYIVFSVLLLATSAYFNRYYYVLGAK